MNILDVINGLKSRKYRNYANISFSQEGEDRILIDYFMDRYGNDYKGCYVDLGAHHPIRFSNTYLLYKHGWSGVNIDATPGSMIPFNKIRKRDINLEIGITKEGNDIEFYTFDEGALNTFDSNMVKYYEEKGYRLKEKVMIHTDNIMNILGNQGLLDDKKKVDLFDIDIEGLDNIIIEDIDWNRFRPTVVMAEVDLRKNEIILNAVLVKAGYRLIGMTRRTGIYSLD